MTAPPDGRSGRPDQETPASNDLDSSEKIGRTTGRVQQAPTLTPEQIRQAEEFDARFCACIRIAIAATEEPLRRTITALRAENGRLRAELDDLDARDELMARRLYAAYKQDRHAHALADMVNSTAPAAVRGIPRRLPVQRAAEADLAGRGVDR